MIYTILIALILFPTSFKAEFSSSKTLSQQFDSKFHEQCSSYPFVQRYKEIMQNPSDRSTIFVFHEAGASVGGLGDRFAGVISALAYSLRFNRSFVIAGDASFYDYFQPNYGNSSYSQWLSHLTVGMETISCINPKPGRERVCGLYHDSEAKTVKIYLNRCYLCRWLFLPQLNLQESLKSTLGIDHQSDLFQVAGCLFRLAMKPTDLLWHDLEAFLASQGAAVDYSTVQHQVGIHFRCGDSSLISTANPVPNPQCLYTNDTLWQGTSFADDKSMESPIDLGTCALNVLYRLPKDQSRAVIYLASDNTMSAQQINNTMNYPTTIIPQGACHVDMAASKCTSLTLLHWFALSLSDTIITQALITEVTGSIYHDPHVGTPENPMESGPVSAFSRFAAVYGLSMHHIYFGRGCLSINATRLSHQTSGNWVCTPRKFF